MIKLTNMRLSRIDLHEVTLETLSKFILPGILFLLTLVFGFWLSKIGKPYNVPLFNVHKLIALGAVVFATIQFFSTLKGADSLTPIIVLLVVAALCVIALFASGAFLSIGNLDYALTLTIHRIALAILTLVLALIGYLLTSKL